MQLTFRRLSSLAFSSQTEYWLDRDGNVLDTLCDRPDFTQPISQEAGLSRSTLSLARPRSTYDRYQAAVHLSISIRSVDYYVANKAILTVRRGRKEVIPHSELVRFAKENGLYGGC